MEKTWLSMILIISMILIFFEINYSVISLNFFQKEFSTEQYETFSDYYDSNTKYMNSFVDPTKNDPIALLNDPTKTRYRDKNMQSFNDKNYFIGKYPNEFITPKLIKDDLNIPSTMDQNELNVLCKNMDNDDCVSSSFCSLVGDSIDPPKCLPGNNKGPLVRYSDINVDYYYYKNICYGNCPGKYGSSFTLPPAFYTTSPSSYTTSPSSYTTPPSSYTTPPSSYTTPPDSYTTPPDSYTTSPSS